MKKSSFLLFKIFQLVLFFSSNSISSIFIELFLSDSDLFWCDFKKLVISQVTDSFFNRHDLWWNQHDSFIMSMGTDISKFLLFSWVDLKIFFFIVFTDNQTIINSLASLDKQGTEFFNFL